ncbi:acyl-CoA thioesterase II [Kwoniella dejecticola CBS 10117]|uniref:Acyl-CoA thioesterase II n=1 Tax=Kwoniella dejecticola CBS 10117 TaxID=1296121 RepID=A0A1A6A179_9TREE|nr:acyl-CoA thioesterase II [Kwoniella dejecticola CBS 10117]OBR83813.1 acyl-CoA thioesterase II [Kwoniella dejecticola CBS 10117]
MAPFARLTDLVAVTPHPSVSDSALSTPLWVPSGARGVFGGQVIAQSLAAATRTITSPFGLHSMHCYFLLPALASPDIQYQVERLRDGKSYSNRLVRAYQGEREVFVLLASYTIPPTTLPGNFRTALAGSAPSLRQQDKMKVSHTLRFSLSQSDNKTGPGKGKTTASNVQAKYQTPFPKNLRPYHDCYAEEDRWQRFFDERCQDWSEARKRFLQEYIRERRESPVGISRARFVGRESSQYADAEDGAQHTRMSWLRARLDASDKPDTETVKAMIAYMSDFQFIGTASRSVGMHQSSTPRIGMLASLDHSIHFYPFPDNFDPSAPLLHVMESQSVDIASGRGVVQGRIYTQEGVLIAVTAQEGVVRADLRGLEARGLVEGGAVGEDSDDHHKKREAKL